MELNNLEEKAEQASTLLKAMSNQSRLLILCQLNEGEKSVGELERIVGLSQSALSQHLARLRRDKLVQTRREAQTIYYSLNGDDALRVIETLYGLYCNASRKSVAA
ncbi:ArsR family transcriptional regulator [Thalassospira sp. HJ]|uniref:ArsR/SmtB family transcription factor n=1 Tax=unclassified Thalassospira TaxID=2648997 RepID=UPI0005CF5805|nr:MULTISPECIES: metalloregulator ArsR/SmtB family transcription factor [unclassified Thalassospira]KJE35079.1 ArsR family transcriptional regulator [Thalassospira sp. HJ]MBC07155.1 ArsR family transcriptional regulator [Thalassospira sp.]|tara:strand:- start:149 stop:466 length:318 start_codon:yes stop_codon:yes gene_type:complete|eukprot:TRINITY_DN30449_c0_g1_i1.p1 TRINITY_DN30449_c0_g1~~TRINITY_DN30449_c0_g1_i1.p1  ORF type:complete len:106 (-),score=11.84 TRINITY_DN30449_c0_g1_i1:29-346(-)